MSAKQYTIICKISEPNILYLTFWDMEKNGIERFSYEKLRTYDLKNMENNTFLYSGTLEEMQQRLKKFYRVRSKFKSKVFKKFSPFIVKNSLLTKYKNKDFEELKQHLKQ